MSSVPTHTPPGERALTRTSVETLAEAYLWLDEVRMAHAGFLVARAERLKKLESRARYVLGSLDAARGFLAPSPGAAAAEADAAHTANVVAEREAKGSLAPKDAASPFAEMVEKTRAELDAARAEFDAWAAEEAGRFDAAFEAAMASVVERAEAYLAHHRPRIRVEVAQVGADRCIVHVHRPEDDDGVLLCQLVAGKPPSHRDFLRDDAVLEVGGPVHLATLEPGVDPASVTAGGAEAEDALVRDWGGPLLPIRAHCPVRPPGVNWPRLRLKTRGPVLELESRISGAGYGHVVPAEHGELFTGFLVSLRARGLLEVDVDVV